MTDIKKKITQLIQKNQVINKINFNKFIFYFLFGLKSQFKQFKINMSTNCIILSQYPGAEMRGLGGLIAQNPKSFEILCFTNGSSMVEGYSGVESSNIKKQQFFDVMKTLRVKGYKIFDIEDKTLKNHWDVFKKIDISEADYVFVPNVYDNNIDTIALLKHFKQLLKTKEHKQSLKIVMFESDFPLCTLDYYVDISTIIETKKKMLLKYYPEDKFPSLVDKIIGLNAFRCTSNECDYCEGLMIFNVDEFLDIPMI